MQLVLVVIFSTQHLKCAKRLLRCVDALWLLSLSLKRKPVFWITTVNFFALIHLGFEYWSPDVSLISEPEYYIAHETAKQFCQLAGREDMYETHGIEIANIVLSKIKKQRESHCDPEAYKCIENYRYQVMIEAGYFDLEMLPNGGTVKRPWSIAFENADQEQFEKIYKGCFNVIWNQSLFSSI